MTEASAIRETSAGPSRSRTDAAVELLLYPERYFETLLRSAGVILPWLVIWVCGVAQVVDNLDFRLLAGTLRPDAAILTSWPALWGAALVGGFIAGLLNWLIGGWWYRMRMNLSGARGVNKRQARLVYMHTQLVWCVPTLVWLVLVTTLYSDYHAAYVESPMAFAFLPTLPWSVWVSYRGVRHCFNVQPWWARVWFLILPLTFYGATIGLVLIISWFGPF
jgi:hypothetical protein